MGVIINPNIREGGILMSYKRPEIKEFEMPLEVKTMASEITSCAGGHCVRARYENDY